MSSTVIDEKIVQMQFDNAAFEKGIKTTRTSLTGLDKDIQSVGTKSGLSSFSKDLSSVNLKPFSNSLNEVKLQFSALQIAAATAISKITTDFMNAGEKIVKMFTIDPIKTGFQEYETQINAVQTILANTAAEGTNINVVNKALDELNLYADKTIYNFTEMTKNIGTFTAAGVKLDDSVNSIKGIANLAAASGSTSQQASTAMYQLSQALAAGRVTLMDWNSVVNAGMGGKLFQEEIMRTARAHGVAIDDMIAKEGAFRNTLASGWLSADILNETLAKFTGDLSANELAELGYSESDIQEILALGEMANDAATKVKTFTQLMDTLKEAAQSGWSQTWRTLVGDFEEAKEMFTYLSDTFGGLIGQMSDQRNTMLKDGLYGSWDKLMGEGVHDETELMNSLRAVYADQGKDLDVLIEEHGTFDKVLKAGLITSDDMSASINLLTAKYGDLSIEQLEQLGYTEDQIIGLKNLNSEIQNGKFALDDYVAGFTEASGRENLVDALKNSIEALGAVLAPIRDAFTEIFPPTTGEQVFSMTEAIKEFTAGLKISEETAEKVKNAFIGVFSIFKGAITLVKNVLYVLQPLGMVISTIGNAVLTLASNLGVGINSMGGMSETLESFRDVIENISFFLNGLVMGIFNLFGANNDLVKNIEEGNNVLTDSIEKIKKVFDDLANSKVGQFFGAIKEFAMSVYTFIEPAITKLKETFVGFMNSFADKTAQGDLSMIQGIITAIVTAMAGFSISGFIKNLGTIPTSIAGMIKSSAGILDGFKGILNELSGTLKAFQASIKADIIKDIATAVLMIAGAIFILAFIPVPQLAVASGAMIALMGSLLLMTSLMNNIDLNIKQSASIALYFMALGTSLLSLSIAIAILSILDTAKVIGVMLTLQQFVLGLTLISKLLQKGNFVKAALNITLLGLSLHTLVLPISILSFLPIDNMIQSMMILAGALVAFSVGLRTMQSVVPGALALTVASTGLIALSVALIILSNLDMDSVLVSMAALGGTLVSLTIGLKLLESAKMGILMLPLASVGIGMLAVSLMVLSKLGWPGLIASLISLVSVMVTMGVITVIFKSAIPAMVAFSVAAGLFGVAVFAIGAGSVLLGAGLAAIAGGIVAFVKTISTSMDLIATTFGSIFTNILKLIITSAPLMAEALIALFEMLATTILMTIPTFIKVTTAVIAALLKVLADSALPIAKTIVTVLLQVLALLADNVPQMIDDLMRIIIGVIDGLATRTPELVEAFLKIFIGVFQGIINAANSIGPEYIQQLLTSVAFLATLMAGMAVLSMLLVPALAGLIALSVFTVALIAALAAFAGIAQIPGLDWIITEGGKILINLAGTLGEIIGAFAGGIAVGLLDGLPTIADSLSDFANRLSPFIEVMSNIDPKFIDGTLAVVGALLAITGASVIDQLTSWFTGENSIEAFSKDLMILGPAIAEFSNSVKNINATNIEAAANAARTIADFANIIPNEGGVLSWFSGDNSMKSFIDQMLLLGPSLHQLNMTLGNSDYTGIETSMNQIKRIFDSINAITVNINIIENIRNAMASLSNVLHISLYDGITQNLTNIENDITFMTDNIAMYIRRKLPMMYAEGKKIADAIENGLYENIKNTQDVGMYISQGLSIGMLDEINNTNATAKKIVKGIINTMITTADINSPAEETVYVGSQLGMGLVVGMTDELVTVRDAAGNLIEIPLKDMEAMGYMFKEQGAANAQSYLDGFDASTLGDSASSFLNDLGLTPEEVEIPTTVTTDTSSSGVDPAKEAYDNAVQLVEDRIDAEQAGAIRTVQLWTELRDTYEENSEYYIEADKKVADARDAALDQFNSKIEEVKNTMQGLQDQYDTEFKNISDSVSGSYSLFDAVEKPEEDAELPNASDLISNLRDQNASISSFYRDLDSLASSGVDDRLVEEFRNMGVAASAELDALLSGTDAQLEEFNNLFVRKFELGDEVAERQLAPMKEALEKQMAEQLLTISSVFEKEAEPVGLSLTQSIVAGMELGQSDVVQASLSTAQLAVEEMAKLMGMSYEIDPINLDSLNNSLTSLLKDEQLLTMFTPALDQLNVLGADAGYQFSEGLILSEKDIVDATEDIVDATSDEIHKVVYEYEESAKDSVQGYADSLKENEHIAIDATRTLGNNIKTVFNETLEIHSPSRVFGLSAYNSVIGYANSIDKYSNIAEQSTEAMANRIVDRMVLDPSVTQDMLLMEDPVIKPVLDLSEFKQSITQMGGLFNTVDEVVDVQSSIQSVSSQNGKSEELDDSKQNQQGTNITLYQTNNSPELPDRGTIYRQTQSQLNLLKGALKTQ